MVPTWVTVGGFDRTNNLDFSDSGSSPIEFHNLLGDGSSKADIRIADIASNLSFVNGQSVEIWDENAPTANISQPTIPAHNLLRKAVALNDTVNWIVTVTNGATVNTSGVFSFTVTYSNNSVSPLVAGLRQYCAAGYVFPGQQYMLSAYVSGSGISNVQYIFIIYWLDAGYNIISNVQTVAAVPGTQTRVSVSGVAPANTYTCICYLTTQASNATNAGVVTIGTPQLEPMYFVSQGVSYPTPDCNFNQTNCTRMPDDTISRTARLFSGYIDDIKISYDGPNRIWELSCAAASALLENDALINYSVINTFDNTIITNLLNAFYPLSIYTGSGTNYNTTSIEQGAVNSFAPQPLVQGISVGTQTWSDASLRDVMNALVDASGYVYWLDPYYTLNYTPAYYSGANFTVVAAVSADNITKIAPQDYSINIDATQRKRAVKVIGQPADSPAITQPFTGTGTQTKFYLSQVPKVVTSVVVAGVTQVAGIAGVNTFGQNLGGGAITVLVSQAGDSNAQVPTPYMSFQVAPANGAAITITYSYQAPVVIQVLDQSQVNNVVAPPYAQPNFWTRVHDTSISDTTTAITRGLAELTKRSAAITKITFKTFLWVTPGMSIFFTSTFDNINNQSFVVRSVIGRLLGPGIHQYEVEASDHPLPDSATTMLRHVHKAHQRSTATASVTTPQETDIVFSEFMAYSESIIYTLLTNIYGSSVADATLTNACDCGTGTGGTETSKTTTVTGTNQVMEITSQGKTVASVTAMPSTPTGNGWVYQPGAVTFPTGPWSAIFTLAMGRATGASSNLQVRFFKYSGGIYTSLGIVILVGTFTTTKTTYTLSNVVIASFATGASDLIYIDAWLQDSSGNSADNPIVYESTSSSSGVVGDVQIYFPTPH